MSDWRLHEHQEYLHGLQLRWAAYTPYREGWDHDHCELCFATVGLQSDDLKEGYTTPDRYRWICRGCFDDFQSTFAWTVAPADGAA